MRATFLGCVVVGGCGGGRLLLPPDAEVRRLPEVVLESSGLARSASFGMLWTHGDSGTAPRLFEVSTTGRLARTVDVEGVSAIDWEDVAPDGQGGLWIADTGNNANNRRNLALHHVSAAALASGAEAVPSDRTIRLRYPEQTGFPMPERKNFDAEALFVDGERLYLLTKHRSDAETVLYRIPTDPPSPEPIDAIRLDAADVGGAGHRYGGMVTAADLHPDGTWLAVLTYHAILVFRRPSDGSERWLSERVATVPIEGSIVGQCEAISWDGSGLIVTNEGRDVFRLDDVFAPGRRLPPSGSAGADVGGDAAASPLGG